MSRSHNTEDPKLRAELADLQNLEDEQRDADIMSLMATPLGRRFLWWLIDKHTNVHGTTFTGDNQTFHNEGQRFVGVTLMLHIHRVAPQLYSKMVEEGLADLMKNKAIAAQKRAESAKTRSEEDGSGDR